MQSSRCRERKSCIGSFVWEAWESRNIGLRACSGGQVIAIITAIACFPAVGGYKVRCLKPSSFERSLLGISAWQFATPLNLSKGFAPDLQRRIVRIYRPLPRCLVFGPQLAIAIMSKCTKALRELSTSFLRNASDDIQNHYGRPRVPGRCSPAHGF